MVVTPGVLTDRVADVGPKALGVKATPTVQVAAAAKLTPLQLSDVAVNCVPAREATLGLTVIVLTLVTVKVVVGDRVPSSTVP